MGSDPARTCATRYLHRYAIVTAIVAVAAVVTSLHAATLFMEHRARNESLPLDRRVELARHASAIEPFNAHLRITYVITRAEQLADEDRYDDAYRLLEPYAQTTRDGEFREIYERVVAIKLQTDARKAHQQHAHEQTGGALAPQDVER